MAEDFDMNESMMSLDTLPTEQHPQRHASSVEEEDASTSLEASSQIVRALFGGAVGECWGDYFCTHQRIRGRLYATSLAVLFHSNLLGFERRICLRYCEIVEMELVRTTSIRITMFDSEQYVLRSFNDRVQVLRMLKGLKILSDRRSIGGGGGRQLRPQPHSLPSLNRQISDSVSDSARLQSNHRHQQNQSLPRPSSAEGSNAASRRRLSSSSEHQHQPLVSNRRRAVSDSCTVTAANSPGVGSGLLLQPPPTVVRESPFRFAEGGGNGALFSDPYADVADDASFDQSVVQSAVEDGWNAARDQFLSASDVITGIESLELPVTLERFFQLFLADGAPFGLDWYQEHRVGDRDIELTGWDLEDGAGGGNDDQALKRSMAFTHPISGNLVGPSQARTMRHQRLRRFEDYGIVLENTTVIVDNIPSADAFYVHDHWLIEASRADPHQSITLSTHFAARFTKRALFRGMIEKSVARETATWFQGYAEMVQSKIQESAAAAIPDVDDDDDTPRAPVDRPAPRAPRALQPAAATATATAAADSSLPVIVGLLQKILGSMNVALVVGACGAVLVLCLLAYQVLLMRSALELMRHELDLLRLEVERHAPLDLQQCKAAAYYNE